MNFANRLNYIKAAISFILGLSVATTSFSQSKSIVRMGTADAHSFDEGWLFNRYGLQPDGSSMPEPGNLENFSLNDAGWRKLNLPRDWAITGTFRRELEGATGKLPWKGIGWRTGKLKRKPLSGQ